MFAIPANLPFLCKKEDIFVNFVCPSLEWFDRAKEVTSFIGTKFIVVFPEKYKENYFLGKVRVGSSCVILVSVLNSDYGLEALCRATLESFERIRVRDLQDLHLKGVLGLQYAEQLVAWFNSPEYLEEVGADESDRRLLRGNDFICLAEFKVITPAEGPEE